MPKASQATWGGRFTAVPADLMLQFSESVSFDRRLAPFDIAGSKAHSAMLAEVGLITAKECAAIHGGLDAILAEIATGTFTWNTQLEDVHMNIEHALTQRVPAAAKLHTARSRNDQIATDMRLWFKFACGVLREKIANAERVLLAAAAANRDLLIPGYTHLQRAQPVYLAHHLFAWLEMLDRDRARFAEVADHANWCPLGAGALAGTTLPIDRELTATLLGFTDAKGRPQVTQNSMDTVADRDGFIEFATACALLGVHLSRIAEDLILWSSAEFKFVELSDAFSTGSSLMPQKKNPDIAELTRGKSARVIGNLVSLLTLLKGLPCAVILSGYPSALYDAELGDWQHLELQVMNQAGVRTEKLWFNFTPERVHWARFAGKNFTDRQRIKRKAESWARRYRAMPAPERLAVLAALMAVEAR